MSDVDRVGHGTTRAEWEVISLPCEVRKEKTSSDESANIYMCTNPHGGLISHLTDKCQGNVHDLGFVIVTGSVAAGDSHVRKVIDLDSDSYFWATPPIDILGWANPVTGCMIMNHVCYDFKTRRIVPRYYIIWSHNLVSWDVDTSLDGTNWTNVDHQENILYLNASDNFVFGISQGILCQYVRLANGKNRSNTYSFMISVLEFFGELHDEVAAK
jgi:hypothetical protein